MRRVPVALLAATALLTMTLSVVGSTPAAAASPTLGPDGVVMTCTDWSIPSITFDTDTDGNGNETATLVILSSPADRDSRPVTIFQQTYTFPVGTTTSLSGTYTTPPVANPINAQIEGQSFVGACDQNPWIAPALSFNAVPPGDPFYVLFAGCELTTTDLTVTDAAGDTVFSLQDEVVPWPFTGPFRPVYASFPVTLPAGFGTNPFPTSQGPDQVWHVTASCGTTANPLSATSTREIPLYTTPAEPPTAPPAQPVGASAGLTG